MHDKNIYILVIHACTQALCSESKHQCTTPQIKNNLLTCLVLDVGQIYCTVPEEMMYLSEVRAMQCLSEQRHAFSLYVGRENPQLLGTC